MRQDRNAGEGRRGFSRALRGGLLALLVMAAAGGFSALEAEQPFSLKSLEGSYALLADGRIPGVGAVVAIGVFGFDGEGGCTFTETLNIVGGGGVERTADGCTYTVNPDGTGTITEVFGSSESHLGIVLADGGDEIRLIVTDPGIVASGTAKKQ